MWSLNTPCRSGIIVMCVVNFVQLEMLSDLMYRDNILETLESNECEMKYTTHKNVSTKFSCFQYFLHSTKCLSHFFLLARRRNP